MQPPRSGRASSDPGATKLWETRRAVVQGWNAVADRLLIEGHPHLAQQVWKLIGRMPAPQTDDQRLQTKLAMLVDEYGAGERTR